MINLFVGYYLDKNKERQTEINTCLYENINNELIGHIYILVEKPDSKEKILKHDKITKCVVNKRPTYDDFFAHVDAYTDEEDINIISNSDMYFDKTIKLVEDMNMDNKCLALTRWDLRHGNQPLFHNVSCSQDVWIVQGKVKNGIWGNFFMGIPGCDNRIAYELKKAGYDVINPSHSIKTYHLHITGVRNYNRHNGDLIPEPHLSIKITKV